MLNDVSAKEKRSLPQKTGGYYPIFKLCVFDVLHAESALYLYDDSGYN